MIRETFAKHLLMTCSADKLEPSLMEQLVQTLTPYQGGTCPLLIKYQKDNIQTTLRLGSQWKVVPSEQLLQTLREKFPQFNITLQY